MSHAITGLIAASDVLKPFSKQHGLPDPIPLYSSLFFLPLSDDDLDKLLPAQKAYTEGFVYLSDGLMKLLGELSRTGDIAYIETDYFGGVGSQGALLFRAGRPIYGPKSAETGPISEALRLMGVQKRRSDHDEFESAGLHIHRSNEEWLAAHESK